MVLCPFAGNADQITRRAREVTFLLCVEFFDDGQLIQRDGFPMLLCVFKTMKFGGISDFAGVHSTFDGHGEMPQFKLNFNYRFGNNQVKAARQRNSAIEDEKKRADGGGQGVMRQ